MGCGMTGLRNFEFRPIDDRARDGAFHLLEASDATLHSGRWGGSCFVYACGQPIEKPICSYALRVASQPTQSEMKEAA